MDPRTIAYYASHVKETAKLYNATTGRGISDYFAASFKPGSHILDIGAGTGRDVAILLDHGYDAYGVEAAEAMVNEAIERMPALAGRLTVGVIPTETPFVGAPFDGILCSAVLMHITDEVLFDAAFCIRRNLAPGGRLLLSIPVTRDDLGPDGRDSHGRLFQLRPTPYYRLLFERLGFHLIAEAEESDSLGRGGIRWAVLSFVLEQGFGTRPIDAIESIINRDRKTATYKLALFRALCDIALAEYNSARWYPGGQVGISIDRIADKWIEYYWPIVGSDEFIPQIRGERSGEGKPILFRPALRALIDDYRSKGGLDAFTAERLRDETLRADEGYNRARQLITTAIVKGPVQHAGGSLEDGPVFDYDAKARMVLVPAELWRELCLMGHWIHDALILRWAELTYNIADKAIPISHVVELLLTVPNIERDTKLAREIFNTAETLECVWTGKDVRSGYDVDHVIPYTLWHNNDLWNLLPASPPVNNRKRDRLPTRELLFKRRDAIVNYWEIVSKIIPHRFSEECARFTGKRYSGSWQIPLFSALVEAVEITALQRGIERWEGGNLRPSG